MPTIFRTSGHEKFAFDLPSGCRVPCLRPSHPRNPFLPPSEPLMRTNPEKQSPNNPSIFTCNFPSRRVFRVG